jgi:hypothetical protein
MADRQPWNGATLRRAASGITARFFALLPRRARFGVARWLAVAIGPLLRHTSLYRRRPSFVDGYREDAFRMLKRAMTTNGILFDPSYVVIGGDQMNLGPAVILSGHFLNNTVLSRWLYDRGDRWCLLEWDTREQRCYLGVDVPFESISTTDPASLIKARSRLRDGLKVISLIDSILETEQRVPVETVVGTRYISPALPQLAVSMNLPVFFTAVRFDDRNRIVVIIERAQGTDASQITAEFCEFLRRQTAAVRR